jgi:hypothetical protein
MADEEMKEEKILVSTGKTIGTIAGKLATLTGAGHSDGSLMAKKTKLPKKNKSRLPRRQKKAHKVAKSPS